jgi:AAA domain (dynein-related subfamily)./Dynein heavy chain, N-terminal region 2./Dynein heavy chain, N-terminal region 1./Dynein heavy chain.
MDMTTSIVEETLLETDQLYRYLYNLIQVSQPNFHLVVENGILGNFISAHSPDTLYIVKFDDDEFHVINDLNKMKSKNCSLNSITIIIKLKGQLNSSVPPSSQLNLINIPTILPISDDLADSTATNDKESYKSNNELFEKLRNVINLGLSPYFDLITSGAKLAVEDDSQNSSTSISQTKKKFNELSLSLQHLQQRILTPDLLISVHPKIKHLISTNRQNDDDVQDQLIGDSSFLNELTNIVNNWIKQIQAITKLNHNPLDGDSITEEVQFWKSMESSLLSIGQQMSSQEIKTSIEILNKAKRFHITLSFQNDIGLSDKLNTTKLFNSILKELPIDELISVSNNFDDLEKFEIAIINIFNHLKVKFKSLNSFPLTRSIELIEIILNDITNKLKTILTNLSMMSLPLSKFQDIYSNVILKIFTMIEQNIKYMVNLIRELLRKRQEKFIIIKIDQTNYNNLRERCAYIKDFRLNHHDLLLVLEHFITFDSIESNKLRDAYNKYIIPINVFDLSMQGNLIWSMNEESYLSVFKQSNAKIISNLNELFETCSCFNDFISIFDKFNSYTLLKNSSNKKLLLFINDEYKLKMLSIANVELEQLLELNLNSSQYLIDSLEEHNQLLNFKLNPLATSSPSIVSQISWNISIVSKLKFYLDNLQKLLGTNWNKYSLGSKIEAEITSVMKDIDPDVTFEAWIENIPNSITSSFEKAGPVVKVIRNSDENYSLHVNFDYSLIDMSHELQQLTNLGFRIPVNLLIQSRKVDRLYPFIVGLVEHISIFNRILEHDLTETSFGLKFGFLVEEQKAKIQHSLKELTTVDWIYLSQALDLQDLAESNTEGTTTNENLIEIQSLNILNTFQKEIYILYDQVNKLSKFDEFLNNAYYELKICLYQEQEINDKIKLIQHQFLKLALDDFASTSKLCNLINSEIETILIAKCEWQLLSLKLNVSDSEINNLDSFVDDELVEDRQKVNQEIAKLQSFEPLIHAIVIQDQSFQLSPPLANTKQYGFTMVNHILSVIGAQSLVKSSISSSAVKMNSNVEQLRALIATILSNFDSNVSEGEEYFEKWNLLQTLWELDLESDEDLSKIVPANATVLQWLSTIQDILKLKEVFDDSESFKIIGNVLKISFARVQSRASIKFDNFQSKVIQHFSLRLEDEVVKLNIELSMAIESLEKKLNFQTDIIKLVFNIDNYLSYKSALKDWVQKLEILKGAQLLLTKQRFKFPSAWIFTEQLENNISIITSLFKHKQALIEDNFEIISSKIKGESTRINYAIESLLRDWPTKKPVSGHLNPSLAMSQLDIFQKQCSSLQEDKRAVTNVSKLLNIPTTTGDDISDIFEEIQDLKSVWSSINTLWDELLRMKAFKWEEVQPRKLRRQLDDLLALSRSFPSKVRQYAAFDEIQNIIKSHLKNFGYINDLKSESMKGRHWRRLLSELVDSKATYETLTVGSVWDLNFDLNETAIKSILNQANNEQTIEDNLAKIRKEWSTITFEMFNYENKCRLVKNWDKLFDQCNNDINTLSSMKNSPYYSSFEQEVTELETKFNKLFLLLDTWIDVQLQWVYLDGVFGNKNNDIKSLLPIESTRFTNITYEFLNILKRIYKFNLVIDVLLIPDVHAIMVKFLDSLVKVRKSLADYLEKQRELFPRFYFVGNQDLLEIIGSAVDFNRINRHFKKMFSGIDSVDFNKDSSTIVAINSEKGEKVKLTNPVSLIKFPRLHEWLSELELEVKFTLSNLTSNAVEKFHIMFATFEESLLLEFITQYPAQVSTLASQIGFTSKVNEIIHDKTSFADLLEKLSKFIAILTQLIGANLDLVQRKRIEYLVIEVLHQRNIITSIVESENKQAFIWNIQQQFYFDHNSADPFSSVTMRQAKAEFTYGFEYLGIPEKLAYTPLINKCYLTMTQALDQKLGGSPFGPAGTGKTESIKALGNNLGKMVLVFNCDDSFDFQSMGRIFLGLSKVGTWGCFDEFNRLDEKILSAVSSQIENIEMGLKTTNNLVEISGKTTQIHPETGIFVTMNPGYVGRNELPENLKKLFRSFSMERPDREVIAEVFLTSQTFLHAKHLASVIVPFFLEVESSTSKQTHYDFGLRTLKTTLIKCGLIKRSTVNTETDSKLAETKFILQSIMETIAPKLIKDDEVILNTLKQKYFPGINYDASDYSKFVLQFEKYCEENGLHVSENWATKALQLYQVQNAHNGIMLVGESGSGKSTVCKLVLNSLSSIDNKESMMYSIDCKVLSKDEIYGSLDEVTRDWTDGLFTSILRKIIANSRGELSKRIWIIFDGDIDPEWVENLNSVLDDNKILTLPNGERLGLPPNVRLVFEVDNLKYTTPATVSRCGMIWFDTTLVPIEGLFKSFIFDLSNNPIDLGEELVSEVDEILNIQKNLVSVIQSVINAEVILSIINECTNLGHIMEFTIHRTLRAFSATLGSYCRRYIEYCLRNRDIPIDDCKRYIGKAILLSAIWAFAGDSSLDEREKFGDRISKLDCFGFLDQVEQGTHHIDYDISLPDFEWESWNNSVESIDLEPQNVTNPNTIIPTLDTVRHDYMIYSILNEHKPLILCGPPGSGKTMTLLEALRRSPNLDVLTLNFSKETSPASLMRSLEQHCEYLKTNTGVLLAPRIKGKWVVVFCDEINLPGIDKYGTQRVISLIRQMIEQKGFWRVKDKQWVSLTNIQFVGACNSPNDPGRNKLSSRFLRHASLIMVDYPGKNSLTQIYQTFNLAIMKCAPDLRGYTRTVTDAMIEVYIKTKEALNTSIQDNYIYSPRELTRWTRGVLEGLRAFEYSDLLSLARLWYHEGLRLFYDRLVGEWEQNWTKQLFRDVTANFFQNIDLESTLREPVIYSNWLTLQYEPVNDKELRSFVSERLRVFSEEEIEVDLVLHEDLLDHALRIDRVLRQPQGHMILVGPSTSGKATLSKFVAWINGYKVFQLAVHRNYGINEFDATLRELLLKCVVGESICFLIDESSIMDTSFIERMNTLLANAEIPGLFEGDDYTALMNLCMEHSHAQGLFLDSDEELYSWFTRQISVNLHVVFNISELNNAKRPTVVTSPALFNRCVLSWMGDWSDNSLFDIASTLIESTPLVMSNYSIPTSFNPFVDRNISGFREVIVDAIIYLHRFILEYDSLQQKGNTPGYYLTFIRKFISIFNQKQFELEENQRHISTGLDKLRETVVQVSDLKIELSKKKEFLVAKDKEAKLMLNKMLTEQNEAERKQEFSVETQEELEKQEIEIQKRKRIVMKDLEKAEPAVLEAQRGVQNIKKQHLTEIRSMANPPTAVKMTMESVCTLIGYDVSTWRDVQLIVRRDNFISSIVSFNNEEQLTQELREYMEKAYLSRPEYNYEAVYRASKACGPLLQWVEAQLSYSRILQRIGPLREEVAVLESQTKKTKAQLIVIDQMITELEESIENYKDDYSTLIRDAENIKLEMKSVENRVNRSLKLIDNLTSERERWKASIKKFIDQSERLIGDSLLAAAFIVYAGVFDQKGRELLLKEWKHKLKGSGINFDETLAISKYLISGNEIFKWEQGGLTPDDLNQENFTIMKYSETPVIIDPLSNILPVLPEIFLPKKVTVTSFLSDGFVKQLENAVRFGGIIVIQDAEYYDPILDSILRREICRNGGRMMIKLGDHEIDYSPDFKLFLHTKDSLIDLSPFVRSRTSTINFTITSGSLENRVLNITLQDLKPEVEKKRVELATLLGGYQMRLHTLEEELLTSLSDSTGNILDNDTIVDTLESLKAESTEIDVKLTESSQIMETVNEVRSAYYDVARHSSLIFETFKQVSDLGRFYNLSLETFVGVFVRVLREKGSSSITDLIKELYIEAFATVSPTLMHKHKIVLALMLSLNYYKMEIGQQFHETVLLILKYVEETAISTHEIFDAAFARYDKTSEESIENVVDNNKDNSTIVILSSLLKSLDEGSSFMDGLTSITSFLFSGIGSYSSKYELNHLIEDETSTVKPILLVSSEGYDATFKVENLAADLQQKLTIVSMGSSEGIELANKELSIASTKGHWIIIQNVQMSPKWLSYLGRKLDGFEATSDFKVFLTCSLSSKLPASLMNKCKVLVFENQPGIRNIVHETYQSIPTEILQSNPGEIKHICFLLVWFHATVLERLRYAPISFKKSYDINDSDFVGGLNVIQKLFEQFKKKENVSPDLIPWDELSYLIGEITYGGKIDDKLDLKYIVDLAKELFRIESFESGFNLICNDLTKKTGTKLSLTEGITTETYKAWISDLPDQASLTWVGLEEKVDILLREKQGIEVARTVLDMY